MSISDTEISFSIVTEPTEFPARIDEILPAIEEGLPVHVPREEIMSKCKWVITELITNGYKHSGSDEIKLNVKFTPTELHITKEDAGYPLVLTLTDGAMIGWPVTPEYHNKSLNVICDKLNDLSVNIDAKGRAKFGVKERRVEDHRPTGELTEHFGLIIITRLCTDFIYEFEQGRNIFTTVIGYDAA